MPLLVDKVELSDLGSISSTDVLLERYPNLKERSSQILLELVECNIEEVRSLYVMQHEYAIVSAEDEYIESIFTDDATTCVTGVIRNPNNKMTCLCHFDRIDLRHDVFTFEQICHQLCSSNLADTGPQDELELSLIGGHLDNKNISDNLVIDILGLFSHLKYKVHLNIAFIGNLNTLYGKTKLIERELSLQLPRPMLTGALVTVSNGQLKAAKLNRDPSWLTMDSIPIPMYKLRRAFISFHSPSMSEYLSIYNHKEQILLIPPLKFDRCYFTAEAKNYFEKCLEFTDREILRRFSTSPFVEPEHFVSEIRELFAFILSHISNFGFDSTDLITSMNFPDGKPKGFRLVDSKKQTMNERVISTVVTDSKTCYAWQEV